MEKIIILSPHHDDAVLSCAGFIQEWVKKQIEVEVLTIFTKTGDGTQQMREQEDSDAAKILGIKLRDLNFKDAPVRRSDANVLFQDLGEEDETIKALSTQIDRIANEAPRAIFVSPLGIGWHIDHLVVYEAAKKTISPSRLLFYEDAPYRNVRFQSDLRINGKDQKNFDAFTEALMNAKYVKAYLGHWDEARIKENLTGPHSHVIKDRISCYQTISLTESTLKKAEIAYACYRSQTPFLPEHPDSQERLHHSVRAKPGKVSFPSVLEGFWAGDHAVGVTLTTNYIPFQQSQHFMANGVITSLLIRYRFGY